MMRIDNSHVQQTLAMNIQQQKEVPGEREPDGDSDDAAKAVAKNQTPTQVLAEGTGNKVNILV
jgi:hypothetical protein